MKVNIKNIFLFPTSILFQVSSIFSLLFVSLWSCSLSLLRHSLSLLKYSLSSFWFSLSLWSWSRFAKCWDGGVTRHGCILCGHQLQELVGFGGLVSVGFTSLIFFSLFFFLSFSFIALLSFTPRGKPWGFGFGSKKKSKEMKMVGARAVEKGWPERGFVEVWWVCGCGFVEDGRLEHGGGWLWVCGGGAVGLGLWRWGCAVGLLQTKEKEDRRGEIEKEREWIKNK